MVVFKCKFNRDVTASINKNQFKKLLPLIMLFSFIFILIGVANLFYFQDSFDIGFGIFFIVFGVFFIPLVILLTKIIQKRRDQSLSLMSENTEETYKFDVDKLYITTIKGDEFTSEIVASYNYLYKIIETKTHYFLYISKVQTHVVNKCDIAEGTIEELNNIFALKFDNKHFIQNKK